MRAERTFLLVFKEKLTQKWHFKIYGCYSSNDRCLFNISYFNFLCVNTTEKTTLTQLQASLLERTLSAKQANLIRDTSISSNLVMNDDPCSN